MIQLMNNLNLLQRNGMSQTIKQEEKIIIANVTLSILKQTPLNQVL